MNLKKIGDSMILDNVNDALSRALDENWEFGWSNIFYWELSGNSLDIVCEGNPYKRLGSLSIDGKSVTTDLHKDRLKSLIKDEDFINEQSEVTGFSEEECLEDLQACYDEFDERVNKQVELIQQFL